MSSGSASSSSSRSSGPASPASPSAGSARLPTITGCTNSTATWRASERAGGGARRPPRSRPPRAKRSAMRWHRRARRAASARRTARWPPGARPAGARTRSRTAPGEAAAVTRPPPSARRRARDSHVAPRVDALAGARADEHALDVGVHRVEVVQEALEVEVEVRQQVDLVDQHELAGAEHQRVLQRLVLALGDRGDHHARVLADAELGRADEVADVLDDQQVDLVQRQRGQRRAHHVGVEVALAAEARVGVELRHRHVQAGEPVGVDRALHVALEHADAHAVEPSASSALEQRRLAGARRAHQVDDGDAVARRSRRGWRARSCCWRRARPRRPSPSCGACGLLFLDVDRLHQELLAADDRRVGGAAGGAAEVDPVDLPLVAAARSAGARRSSSCSSRAPSQTVPRATCSK